MGGHASCLTSPRFDEAVSDDLNTAVALTVLEDLLALKKMRRTRLSGGGGRMMDAVLGLGLLDLARADLRLRPKGAAIADAEIEEALARRKAARGGEGLRHLRCDPRRAGGARA